MSKYNKKKKYIAAFEGLVDIVSYKGEPAFLVKSGDKLSIELKVKLDKKTHYPPPANKIPWLLPNGEKVIEHYEAMRKTSECDRNKAIYEELVQYHKAASELPSEEHYDLLAIWVLHTYLHHSFEYSPILCLYAVPERGKSRTGKSLTYIAYRGVHVESLRESYITRLADSFNASIFFDVMDIWKKVERNASEDILLQRFEKGAKVAKVLEPEKGPINDLVYFSVYGPTIIATNVETHKILDTRAITINMPETSKSFDKDVKERDALPLREKLVAFKAMNMDKVFEDIPKPTRGRLGDIMRPLHSIIRFVCPDREPGFLRLIDSIKDSRLINKSETMEAQLLTIVKDLGYKVHKGKLPVREITEKLNEDKSERAKIDSRTIGRKLDSLGFEKLKTGNGASAIRWDENKLNIMLERYGLNKTSETSEKVNQSWISDLSESDFEPKKEDINPKVDEEKPMF